MDDGNLKKLADLVDERVSKALSPIMQGLDDLDTGLKRTNEKIDSNSASLLTIEKEIKSYADSYQQNQRNIEKLDKRLDLVEDDLGIEPPEEHKVEYSSSELLSSPTR